MKTPWSVKFEPEGGYDGCYSGYHILDASGEIVCVVDISDHLDVVEGGPWSDPPRVREIAEFIVSSVNRCVDEVNGYPALAQQIKDLDGSIERRAVAAVKDNNARCP